MLVQDVPDAEDASTWVFQVLMSWMDRSVPDSVDLESAEGRMAFFKMRAEEYAEPLRSVGRAVAEDTWLPLDRGTY